LRDRRDHASGKHPRHDGHDAREIGVALREVGGTIEIGLEERNRIGVPRLHREIRVRAAHPVRLPRSKTLEGAGEAGTRAPRCMQLRRAREFAHEHGVGRIAGIQRVGQDGGRAPPGRARRRTVIVPESLAP
jgi:hypothetical protein